MIAATTTEAIAVSGESTYASNLRHDAYDVVVLSPHFDDAVYSLAATIRLALGSGQRVVVVTVFGHGQASAPSAGGYYGDYAAREREDLAAMNALGVDYVWLNRAEWTFRSSTGRTRLAEFIPHLSFRGTALLAETTRLIESTLESLAAEGATVYAPLAVGAHADHRLVHEAMRELGVRWSTRYYEDVPYALDDVLVQARLAILCALPGPRTLTVARATAKIVAHGVLRLFATLPIMLFLALSELHRRSSGVDPSRVDPLSLRAFDHDVSRFAREKAEAVALYASQTALFFEPTVALESQLARGRHQIIERSWRIAP